MMQEWFADRISVRPAYDQFRFRIQWKIVPIVYNQQPMRGQVLKWFYTPCLLPMTRQHECQVG